MRKRILLILLIISVLLFLVAGYRWLQERQVKALSVAFIEETYGENCPNEMRARIYGKEDGYYAVSVRPIGDHFKAFYLQIKLSMWLQTEEILDAYEFNSNHSCGKNSDV